MEKIKYYFLWIAGITTLVFIMQNINPGVTDWLVLNDKVYSGQVWRFLTAMFLHGSLTHIMLNMFGLLLFGLILERVIGSKKFLLVYLGSGIFANIISVNFYKSSLGASGAIYGIIGALTIIRPLMFVWAFGLLVPMFVAALIWATGDILRILNIIDPGNTGSIAHLSGIIIGVVAGIFYRRDHKEKPKPKNNVHLPDKMMEQWENLYMKG